MNKMNTELEKVKFKTFGKVKFKTADKTSKEVKDLNDKKSKLIKQNKTDEIQIIDKKLNRKHIRKLINNLFCK